MLKNRFYIFLYFSLTVAFLFPSAKAFACSCVNQDINVLYKTSDLVVFGTPKKNLENQQQRFFVQKTIKGKLPENGLFIRQQESTCRYKQLPLSIEQEYLLFLKADKKGYKLTSRCYNYTTRDGFFNLRMSDTYANIHKSMLPAFLRAQGKIPKIDLYTSYRVTEKGIENWLTIINLENKDIKIFHPSNRQAFTFFVIDHYGNPLPPQGYAKVDPPSNGVLTVAKKGSYNYKISPSSELYFPYLSGTAQFGFALNKNEKYRMHVVYRPYGGTYGATSSKEKIIP